MIPSMSDETAWLVVASLILGIAFCYVHRFIKRTRARRERT